MSLDILVEYIFDHHGIDVQLIFRIGTSCSRHCSKISLVYHDSVMRGSKHEGVERQRTK